jgi:pimeloyl-ACP methyl ester carboxylesterase
VSANGHTPSRLRDCPTMRQSFRSYVPALAMVVTVGCEPVRTANDSADAEPPSSEPSLVEPEASAPSPSSPEPPPSPSPSASVRTTAAPEVQTRVETLDVPGDAPASLVRARDGRPPRIVFFPGLCSNAAAYLHGFAEAAAAHGGALAIDGQKPCGSSGDFHSISSDPTVEEPRLEAALDAAGVPLGERSELLHVGYSLGATLLENLVKKRPERYRHVVLIGSPRDPRKDRLERARTVAMMSCSLDVPHRMKAAVSVMEGAGVRARYFEMPGCTHGNVAEGDRVFGEVFGWARAER